MCGFGSTGPLFTKSVDQGETGTSFGQARWQCRRTGRGRGEHFGLLLEIESGKGVLVAGTKVFVYLETLGCGPLRGGGV